METSGVFSRETYRRPSPITRKEPVVWEGERKTWICRDVRPSTPPHDINFFNNPENIISGSSRVPVCYMDNSAMPCAMFAIALSSYFRNGDTAGQIDCSHCYNDFLDLASEKPRRPGRPSRIPGKTPRRHRHASQQYLALRIGMSIY